MLEDGYGYENESEEAGLSERRRKTGTFPWLFRQSRRRTPSPGTSSPACLSRANGSLQRNSSLSKNWRPTLRNIPLRMILRTGGRNGKSSSGS